MEYLSRWYKEPFRTDMSAADWALFVGFLIVLSILWKLVLFNLQELSK